MSKHRRHGNAATATKPKRKKHVPSFSEETRTSAWIALTELADELEILADYLEPSNEGPPVSQMSAETNARMSQMMARERAERFGYGRREAGPRDPWGLDIIYPLGASKPAGRLSSLDAAAHAHTELVALERRITRAVGFCPLKRPEHLHAATRALRIRSWLTLVDNTRWLVEIDTTAHRLRRYVTHAIDGDPATKLAAPCPYCHRYTLVAYPRRGIIRCDRAADEPCRCDVADGCKECAQGRRHTWRRDEGRWKALAQLLEQRAQERAQIRTTVCSLAFAMLGHWHLMQRGTTDS